MKYAHEHSAMNLLRWHRDRPAQKRRSNNAAGTNRAKYLLKKMDMEVKK